MSEERCAMCGGPDAIYPVRMNISTRPGESIWRNVAICRACWPEWDARCEAERLEQRGPDAEEVDRD